MVEERVLFQKELINGPITEVRCQKKVRPLWQMRSRGAIQKRSGRNQSSPEVLVRTLIQQIQHLFLRHGKKSSYRSRFYTQLDILNLPLHTIVPRNKFADL
jgi:hypothetical protein